MDISTVSVRTSPAVSGSERSDPLPWLPPVLLPDLVNLILHLVLVQPDVLLLPSDVVCLSARPQEFSDYQLCAKAEVFSLDGSDVSLLQILEINEIIYGYKQLYRY